MYLCLGFSLRLDSIPSLPQTPGCPWTGRIPPLPLAMSLSVDADVHPSLVQTALNCVFVYLFDVSFCSSHCQLKENITTVSVLI